MDKYKRTINNYKHKTPYRTILLQMKEEKQRELTQTFSENITIIKPISLNNEQIFINYYKQHNGNTLPLLSRKVTKDFVEVIQQIQARKFPQNTKEIFQKNEIWWKSCDQFIRDVLKWTFTFEVNTCNENIPTNNNKTYIQYKPKNSYIFFPKLVTKDFITAIQRIKEWKIAPNIQEILEKNQVDNIQNFIYQTQLWWIEFSY